MESPGEARKPRGQTPQGSLAEVADMRRLQQISSQLIHEDDHDALYAQLLEAAIQVMGADMGSMQMLSPYQHELRLLAWNGFHPAAAAFWKTVTVQSATTCGMALKTGERVVVSDVETCDFMAGTQDLDFSRLSGIRAVQSTPLVSRSGRILGMISTHWREAHAPAELDLRLLDVLARQAADLIERGQTEAELLRANERFQLAERAANGFVYEWDVRTGQIYRSEGVERMLGYRAEDIPLTWTAWARLVYPGDWQATTDAEELAYLEALPGETLETEYRIRHRDGHYLTVADHALIERDAAGHIVRLIGQTHDITDRKRTEEALRESEAGFRTLSDLVRDLLWRADPAGQHISYNQRWREYTGQTIEETQGYGWLAAIHPADQMTTRADFTHAFASGQPLEIERRIRRRDGQYRWFLLRHAPVRDEQGRITQWFGAATDIHERRMAKAMLEHQVAVRTRELAAANREMQRLSQRILQVQESERRLIAQELHDEIGQQLTGAKMLLDSLDERLHDTRQPPPADQAQQGEREQSTLEELSEARKIVRETLEYVRALSLELRPAVLDSLGLLAALQWQFERYTRQTGVQVDFAADGLDHRLPAQLEAGVYRLVQEALTNVARHAGVSSVTVQIYLVEDSLSLFIVDEGAGFDMEKTLVAGASTGLAGMRERANLLGGSLTIDSLPGEGTTIHAKIFIPQAGEMEATQKIERDDRETPEAKVRRSIIDEMRDRVRDQRRHAARDAERDTMRDAFRDTARDITRDTARDITRDTARDQRHERKGGEP